MMQIPEPGAMMRPIKLVDLAAQNTEIWTEVERELDEIHRDTAYIGGPQVAAFEEEFAEYLGVRCVAGVGSGTDALRLALLALGVGPGDEVITVPMTFIATAAAIAHTGARPVFVDVDPMTCNMSPTALELYLKSGRWSAPNGPKAIMPVHLYGTPAPMTQLHEIAARYGLKIVEDACQAHGARVRAGTESVRAGTVGNAGCFSFYPGKNLGAWGEAGAVATNDEELAERIKLLRDHGRISHYAHQECGYNARLDALQAAVLRAKLRRLDEWNMCRREAAYTYRKLLSRTPVLLPRRPDDAEPCYHLFVIRSERRDAIRNALLMNKIECGIHYPVPLHLQPAFRKLGHRPNDFPASEQIADTVLSLPMHPHLTKLEVARVAAAVEHALESDNSFAGRQYDRDSAYPPPPRG
jgi:dTDP-4-amino-4,6-dideoxygalactose transaminase